MTWKVLYFLILLGTTSAQLWDVFFIPDEEEEEGDEGFWFEEEYENTSKVIKMSSTQILQEKELLEESSEIIVNEITRELRDDLIDANMARIQDIIGDHTIELFNVLDTIDRSAEDFPKERKLNFHDIFISNNNSDERLNEIINAFYNENSNDS